MATSNMIKQDDKDMFVDCVENMFMAIQIMEESNFPPAVIKKMEDNLSEIENMFFDVEEQMVVDEIGKV